MEQALLKTEYGQVMSSNYASLFSPADKGRIQYVDLDDTRSIGWSSQTKEAFSVSGASNTTTGHQSVDTTNVSYVIASPHDVLKRSVMSIVVPDLSLKKEYVKDHQFKIARYFGYAVAGNCELTTSTKFKCTLSTYDQIALFEHLTPKGIKPGLLEAMGDGGICTEWTRSIKKTTVYYPQQWGYSLVEAKGIQLWMLTEKLVHNYELSLEIFKYVNMRKFDDTLGKYIDIDVNPDMFEGDVKMFARPILHGDFSNISPDEKKTRAAKNINTFYIHDMICCDPDNPKSTGNTSASFETLVGLSQAIFFSLENITRPKLNSVCNYTTDVVINNDSKSAIGSVTFTTDTNSGSKAIALPPDLFLTPYGLKNYSTVPGIFVKMYVDKIGKGNNGGSMPQKNNTKIKCTISLEIPRDAMVHLRARALVIKKVMIADGTILTMEDDVITNM